MPVGLFSNDKSLELELMSQSVLVHKCSADILLRKKLQQPLVSSYRENVMNLFPSNTLVQ